MRTRRTRYTDFFVPHRCIRTQRTRPTSRRTPVRIHTFSPIARTFFHQTVKPFITSNLTVFITAKMGHTRVLIDRSMLVPIFVPTLKKTVQNEYVAQQAYIRLYTDHRNQPRKRHLTKAVQNVYLPPYRKCNICPVPPRTTQKGVQNVH